MSDFILARVSQTLAAEQSLETLVRQLLEMLEAVTRMESTYLTRIDTNAQRQQIMFAHNSSEMQIPEGFSVPWDESLCKRALEDQCTFSNDVANRWHSCIAAQELGIAKQPAAQQAYVTSLRQALCGVYFLGEQRIDYEGASFGVVTCDPQSIDVEAALRAADEAMYQDKKSRRQENFIHID
ncbi:hypothetical protein QP231_19850 [Klebsiella pneumoniae]|uniref:hypothetical protein n=1 Tax=Klebsiella pneumoniae TaxID=573 RepID=UPI0025512741|nr:hypothetical protein [Klebsiella pneumoniae]MDK6532364.1 hypothetical protein [Klebsiella pneumoniae]